jgi:hypothetical protein
LSGAGVDVLDRRWTDRDWDRLVDQIRRGDCTPFLGAGACSPTLPMGADLGRSWATHYGYPFDDDTRLPEVMQYASIIEEDPVTVKQHVVRDLVKRGEPDFTVPTEPHSLLARHPIKVFLTTNYDDFMTRALEREGKHPVTAVCPWYFGAEADPHTRLPRDYEPRSDRPLVYHLHGSFRYDASLVLAEQDYVEFLVNLARDLGRDDRRVVPLQILPALTRHPLLFIGYSLRDWSFRMLFHGFVDSVAGVQRRRHVSVQLAPATDPDDEAGSRAEEFLVRYFTKLNISVYWGEAGDFCAELARRLGSS